MPSQLFVRGNAAMQRIRRQISNRGDLVAAKDPTGSLQSCALNASVLGDVVSDSPLTSVRCFGMSNQQKITKITELLKTPQLVYTGITPDHHFVCFSIDVDKVVILQAFQGSYNYIDWYENRGGGIIKTSEFLKAMTDLISNNEVGKLAAAVTLFSYSLSGQVNAHAARIRQDVVETYRNKTVSISAMAHKEL